jgi:hypothetical protein
MVASLPRTRAAKRAYRSPLRVRPARKPHGFDRSEGNS